MTGSTQNILGMGILCITLITTAIWAENPFMGDYEGIFQADPATKLKATAKVVAEDRGQYRIMVTAATGPHGEEGASFELRGIEGGGTLWLFGTSSGRDWNGSIGQGKLNATTGYYGSGLELTKITRQSPSLGQAPPSGAVVLLPYAAGKKTDLSAWHNSDKFPVDKILDDGSIQMNGTGGVTSKATFGDVQLHIEFMTPLEPANKGQHRANSGVFFCGSYEVQVLDSFGVPSSMGDCGALYNVVRPLVNASLPPETWQTYDITFHAARLDAQGKVNALPRITVVHNGITIHKDREIPCNTIDPKQPHVAQGSIHLQDHSNPVRFRNVWLVDLSEKK